MILAASPLINPSLLTLPASVLAVDNGTNQAAEVLLSSLLYCKVVGEVLCIFYSSKIHEQVTSY